MTSTESAILAIPDSVGFRMGVLHERERICKMLQLTIAEPGLPQRDRATLQRVIEAIRG